MNWPNLDKIFIGSAKILHTTNYGPVTREWIVKNNPEKLVCHLVCPLSNVDQGQSLVWSKKVTYYRDGSLDIEYDYNASLATIDNKTIISPIGHKLLMHNLFKMNKNRQKCRPNNDCCSNDFSKRVNSYQGNIDI